VRLALKLSIAFSGAIIALLCGLLWLQYRNDIGYLEAARDAAFRAAVERAARYCGRSEPGEREGRCLEAMRFLALMTDPESFSYAMLVDPESRVLLHSDFLKGDESRRGGITSDLAVKSALSSPASATLATQNARVFSAPIEGAMGKTATFIAVFHGAASDPGIEAVRGAARLRLFQACVLGAAAGILLAAALVAYFLGPLKVIADASRRVAQGDFRSPISEDRQDELGQFAQEFNEMTRRLAELDELKESFVAQVTHDLRNPLNAMIFHAELASGAGGAGSAEQAKSIQVILESGRALSGLINDLLDVSQLEAGRAEFVREPLELRHSVESVGELLRPQAEAFAVGLSWEFQPGVETVCADPEGLRRVITNLVSNALKFTPPGGKVSLQAYRGAANEIVLVVAYAARTLPLSPKARRWGRPERVLRGGRLEVRCAGLPRRGISLPRCPGASTGDARPRAAARRPP